ncbi:hypothetical protein ES707_18323 [subsurface metagenome]
MKRAKSDYDKKWNKEEVQGKKIAKIYDYRDEQGELLFQAIRYEPKAFRQRRPDFSGGYIWDLKDTRRVLYRLRELIKGKDPVFILEGEKDVDNLREWNLTATCCPMGAEKWKSQQKEYNPFLKGREVIIIPDNDEEGERHLDQVASCLQSLAGNVKVLRLPGAKDFSDWKARDKNNTEEKFLVLLSEAQKWKPEKKKVSPQVVSEDKIEGIDQDKLDKLLKEAIPEKSFLRDYIDMFSEVTDTPEAFLFWGAMVTLSTILGKRVWVPWEARKLYSNIWCVFLAPSGFRKGTGIDIPTLLLKRVDETLLLPQVGSEEGLTKTLDSHEGRDTGFVRWQEFSKILRSWSNKQSWQASQEFWIDLWDSKPLRKKLSGGEFKIPTTSISFLSACTPKSFSTFFSPEDLEGGFFGRVYLITSLKKRKYFPIPPSIDRKGDVNELVKELHDIKEYFTGELSYKRIEDSFNHWAKKIQANHEEGFLDSFYSRIETHAMKLAMIYEAGLTRKAEIREESFNYATKALDFLIASAQPLVSEEIGLSEGEKRINHIAKWVQEKREAPRSTIMQTFHINAWEMDNIEKTLQQRELIEIREKSGTRGPAKKIFVWSKNY